MNCSIIEDNRVNNFTILDHAIITWRSSSQLFPMGIMLQKATSFYWNANFVLAENWHPILAIFFFTLLSPS